MIRVWGMHPVPLLAGIIVAVIAVQLGNWQLRRAEEKRSIGERIELHAERAPNRLDSAITGDPEEWSRISVRGVWVPEAVMYLDNRIVDRQPGYHVLMPLRLEDGSHAVVNRGWIAGGYDRANLPQVSTPSGTVELMGRVAVPEAEPFSLADKARDGLLWQYIDLEEFRQWSGLQVGNWLVQQMSETDDGLRREWAAPDLGEDTHRGYALQWFSLAALSIALLAFYVFRSFRKSVA